MENDGMADIEISNGEFKKVCDDVGLLRKFSHEYPGIVQALYLECKLGIADLQKGLAVLVKTIESIEHNIAQMETTESRHSTEAKKAVENINMELVNHRERIHTMEGIAEKIDEKLEIITEKIIDGEKKYSYAKGAFAILLIIVSGVIGAYIKSLVP